MKQIEYRVVWKREGLGQRQRRFAKEKFALRWVQLLTSDEPWKAYGKDPGERLCCSGDECGCGGETVGDSFEKRREGLPKLLSFRIESRNVGAWRQSAGRGEEP